jgi:YVTN family beta-propeller protein
MVSTVALLPLAGQLAPLVFGPSGARAGHPRLPDFVNGDVSPMYEFVGVAPADTSSCCALGEAVIRRLPAGIGVVEGLAGGTDALRPVRVRPGRDRQPAIDIDDGKPVQTAISTIPVNGRVHDIAVNSNSEHAYVALSNAVMVLNREHRVVASIPLPDHPKDLLVDADGKQLIVSQRGATSVVDTDTYTVKTLRDRCVTDVAVSPDGRYLYAAHRQAPEREDADVVTAIDIAGGTTVFKIPLNDVAGLAISPAGALLYAVSYDRRSYYQYPTGRLTIVDAASGTVADAIAVGACPETVTVSPDGTCLSITHYDTHSVSLVNLAAGAVTAIGLRDAPLGMVFTPDSTHVYVSNEHSLTVIDTTTHDAYDLVTGDLPRGLQLSPDGKHAYSTNFGDGTISVIDTITNSITATLDVLSHPEAVAVSADGERVYVGDYWSSAVAVISVPMLRDLLGNTGDPSWIAREAEPVSPR